TSNVSRTSHTRRALHLHPTLPNPLPNSSSLNRSSQLHQAFRYTLRLDTRTLSACLPRRSSNIRRIEWSLSSLLWLWLWIVSTCPIPNRLPSSFLSPHVFACPLHPARTVPHERPHFLPL